MWAPPSHVGRMRPWPPAHRYRGVTVLAGSVAPLTGVQMCFNGLFEELLTGGSRAATSPEAICSAKANPKSFTLLTSLLAAEPNP